MEDLVAELSEPLFCDAEEGSDEGVAETDDVLADDENLVVVKGRQNREH
jgi:hypothetical protein